jgi:hypothetical protein
MAKWNSIDAARKELGDVKLLLWLNQRAANNEYREGYNKVRNQAVKIVRQDPKYRELLAQARKQPVVAAVPQLRKKEQAG